MNELNEGERGGTKSFYSRVKSLKQGFKPRVDFCKDQEGNLIGERNGILERWTEHFSNLLKSNTDIESHTRIPIIASYEGEQQFLPRKDEVLFVIDSLRNNKAPGEDGITAELIKYGGEKLKHNIVCLVQNIWMKENIPKDWGTSIFCPIHKKGDKTICANYRGIALLDIVYKIVSKLIAIRMTKIMENIVGEYQ